MAVVCRGHTYTHCFEHLRPWKTGARALCRQAGAVLGASHPAEGSARVGWLMPLLFCFLNAIL